jgi:hypothetical protein
MQTGVSTVNDYDAENETIAYRVRRKPSRLTVTENSNHPSPESLYRALIKRWTEDEKIPYRIEYPMVFGTVSDSTSPHAVPLHVGVA